MEKGRLEDTKHGQRSKNILWCILNFPGVHFGYKKVLKVVWATTKVTYFVSPCSGSKDVFFYGARMLDMLFVMFCFYLGTPGRYMSLWRTQLFVRE